MKVAVLISGLVRGNVNLYLSNMKYHFPYDYFFATWKGRQTDFYKKLPGKKCQFFSEPRMHYHPVIDLARKTKSHKLHIFQENFRNGKFNRAKRERMTHQTKQILGHAHLLDTIPEEYDMILRIRYDTFLSREVDFSKYLQTSYDKNFAIGFGTRTRRWSNINEFKEIEKIYPESMQDKSISHDWAYFIMDALIMHPRKLFDTEMAFRLHEEKKLMSAEWGWYQLLSEPYGDTHLSVYGGAQLEKFL